MAPALAGLLDLGLQQSGTDYQKIVLRREAFRGAVRLLFESVDLIAVPAQAFAAPTLAKMAALGEDASLIAGLLRFTCPFDMTGSPTITLPGGFAANGGPVAFQFVGRHFDEAASFVPATRSSALPIGTRVIPLSDLEEPFAWQKIG